MDSLGNRIFCNDAMPDYIVDDVARSIAGIVDSARQETAN